MTPEGSLLDEVLLTWMPGPGSYTGEDVVEISCHGNPHILAELLQAVQGEGVRLAAPGEFTYRAFRNGRMSLFQAEAVGELIDAKGNWARSNALAVLAEEGDRWVGELLDALVDIWVPIEADMEFPTDDLDSLDLQESLPGLGSLLDRMRNLTRRATHFSKLQEGYRVVLAGAQNAGKSSLLNKLLGYSRALVTEIPGTTRDTLEEVLEVGGIPIRLVDTAGLGETEDFLDRQGMERSQAAIANADLLLFIHDIIENPPPDSTEEAFRVFAGLAREAPLPPVVLIGNKADLLDSENQWKDCKEATLVSALAEEGLEALTQRIQEALTEGAGVDLEERLMLNYRQAETLSRAEEAVSRAIENIRMEANQDLVATDLMEAKSALEELSGKTLQVDLMDTIFSRFCIGK